MPEGIHDLQKKNTQISNAHKKLYSQTVKQAVKFVIYLTAKKTGDSMLDTFMTALPTLYFRKKKSFKLIYITEQNAG